MTPQEFRAERATGIGGSDVAAVFNVGYGCRKRLWLEKRQEQPDTEREVTGPMELGRFLEPFIAQKYSERSGRQVIERGLIRHPEFPELIVHIDREIRDLQREAPGVLEIKALGRETYFKSKREGMAEDYILQTNHGCLVTGFQWASFAVMNRETAEVLWWDIARDDALCGQIRDECLKFWALVENGPAPDRLPPEDARCHRCLFSGQCQGRAMEELMRAAGAGAVVDRTLGPLVREFLETHALLDEAEEIHKGVKENLKAAMGDRILVEVPGVGKIHFKPNMEWDMALLEATLPEVAAQFRTKYDVTALGKARPELEKHFKRVGTTRPLRIYPAR